MFGHVLHSLAFQRAVAFFALALCACATQVVPGMSQPRASLLAVDITLKPPLGDVRSKPDLVYFAKIDGEGGIIQPQFIRSNFVKDGRAYLLNAAPGTYVAVGAYFSPPMLVTRMDSFTLFSKQIVERSETTVREGELSFMGAFEVDQVPWLDQADEVQTHYLGLLVPKDSRGLVAAYLSSTTTYRGSPGKIKDEQIARNAFYQHARKDVAGSDWVALIK